MAPLKCITILVVLLLLAGVLPGQALSDSTGLISSPVSVSSSSSNGPADTVDKISTTSSLFSDLTKAKNARISDALGKFGLASEAYSTIYKDIDAFTSKKYQNGNLVISNGCLITDIAAAVTKGKFEFVNVMAFICTASATVGLEWDLFDYVADKISPTPTPTPTPQLMSTPVPTPHVIPTSTPTPSRSPSQTPTPTQTSNCSLIEIGPYAGCPMDFILTDPNGAVIRHITGTWESNNTCMFHIPLEKGCSYHYNLTVQELRSYKQSPVNYYGSILIPYTWGTEYTEYLGL